VLYCCLRLDSCSSHGLLCVYPRHSQASNIGCASLNSTLHTGQSGGLSLPAHIKQHTRCPQGINTASLLRSAHSKQILHRSLSWHFSHISLTRSPSSSPSIACHLCHSTCLSTGTSPSSLSCTIRGSSGPSVLSHSCVVCNCSVPSLYSASCVVCSASLPSLPSHSCNVCPSLVTSVSKLSGDALVSIETLSCSSPHSLSSPACIIWSSWVASLLLLACVPLVSGAIRSCSSLPPLLAITCLVSGSSLLALLPVCCLASSTAHSCLSG
jgi:hypothetical protein